MKIYEIRQVKKTPWWQATFDEKWIKTFVDIVTPEGTHMLYCF